MATNSVGSAFSQDCFACLETTKGTAVYPTTAAQRIVTAGTAEINQQASFTDSEEIINSLDLLERFQDQMGAGSWSAPMYIRPSGSLGVAPMGGVLLKSLMGLETIDAGASVTYAQATTKPSFTLWLRKSHTVFFATGCCCETGKIGFTNKGGSMMDLSGGFMQMGWAGTDTLTAAATANAVVVTNAKLFTVGGYVAFGDESTAAMTNTNAGYKITAVNYTSNTLTMADTITQDSGTSIQGFLPVQTALGTPLENKDLAITFDAVAKNLKSYSVDINSPVAWQTDEITTSGYVTEYVEDRRQIKIAAEVLFREQDLSYFYDATQNAKVDVIATINGDGTAGQKCTINTEFTELEVPSVTTSAPTISLSIAGTGLGSAGEDSATIVFT